MLNLHRGQGHDIHTRDSTTVPTESQYIAMVIDKTGGLFRLAVGLMQVFATSNINTNYVPLVNTLGLYFQIRDDLINLADEEYFKSKSFCEDLTEGKFSYPIIHCIRVDDNGVLNNEEKCVSGWSSKGSQLLSILKQRTEDVDVKRYAQRLMFEAGSLHYTREKCTQLKREIVQQISDLGGNEPLLKVIEMLDVQVEKIAELHGDKFHVGTPKKDENRSKNLDYT
jgi:geranylgeranyl diphosphate synthase type 3